MDNTLAFLLSLTFGVLFFLISYHVTKRYIAFMRDEKKKHPNISYVLSEFGASFRWAGRENDLEFESKIYSWLPKLMLLLAVVSLISGLILGYWETWLFLAILLASVFVAFIIAMSTAPKSSSINKSKN